MSDTRRCRVREERQRLMACQSPNKPEKRDPEVDRLLSEPPLPLDDLLDDRDVQSRVGKLIAQAFLRDTKRDRDGET